MALTLTLKPHERIVVNGCAIRNSGRRHVLMIESHADVIRGQDLLEEDAAATPVGKAYFLIQTILIRADLREKLVPVIQQNLAALATVFGGTNLVQIFEAANYVSQSDYYKALRALRPVIRHEELLLSGRRPEAAPDIAEAPAPGAVAGGAAR
ncbi:flagellar biosynthesis repressor FlbT [Actibacterium sp. MT2.3-13A]|uniref:flagellar biosynthesis repressor FlbT n=1 Tax=Actibacterium sp. MT2.3-13A TaxID=2828332 RepID=UPI001BA8F8DE|nr:flagellar biosynthesis repressor FlbT [Actibacterium sp. MT2.3-13A]